MIVTVLATIFVLGVLIFVHEFGHFIVAKLSGIRVERFSLGFPPRAWGFIKGETDYCISWIPLGGYCKLSGMIDESMDAAGLKGEPWEFQSKPGWIKFLTILAGPAMNIILAVLIVIALSLVVGIDEPSVEPRVGELTPGFPAEKAGLMRGDLILSIDGREVATWQDMTAIIHARPEEELLVSWRRGGETRTATLLTRREKIPVDGDIVEVGLIGIGPVSERRAATVGESVRAGFYSVYYVSMLMVNTIKMIVTGAESMKSLGGPIMIGKLAGDRAREGAGSLFSLMAFLSVNLAILNLLPIPVLDGGHLVFIVVEGIIRRPLPQKAKMVIMQAGMAFILLLIAFIFYNDIVRLM